MTYQLSKKKINHLSISSVFETVDDYQGIRNFIDDNDIETPCVLELNQTRLSGKAERRLKGMCVLFDNSTDKDNIVWAKLDGESLTSISKRLGVSVPYISKIYSHLYKRRRN